MPGQRLDTSVHMETPEGTSIELHPAGIVSRSVAFLIDELIRWGIVAVASIVAGVAGAFGMGLFLVVLFVTYWLYGVAFEVLNNGVTPGKRNQKLRVVHDDGTPVRLPASVVRNLLLAVDLMPAMYTGAIVSMLVSRRFQRLGDLAAGTLVVHEAPEKLLDHEGDRDQVSLTMPFAMSLAEKSVFVDYLERSATLTDERAEELASILAGPLGCAPGQARYTVERIALGLRGE